MKMTEKIQDRIATASWLCLFAMVFSALFWADVQAASVNLLWDRSTSVDVGGYKVGYGPSSGNYTAILDAGNGTIATIDNLPNDGSTQYFAVKAYDVGQTVESAYSNEVSVAMTVIDPTCVAPEVLINGVCATPPPPPPPVVCPCYAFGSTDIPLVAADADTGAVELGVHFTADVSGFVSGIRFYKGATNTGTHTGTLWDNLGNKLATATFLNETASGWQEVKFATPVAVTSMTIYVASYFAPKGGYAVDQGYFSTSSVKTGHLTFPVDTANSSNGLYKYGATGGFPTDTYLSSNYWVDVLFDVVTTPVCVAPQVLENNVCITPTPVCVAPEVLVNNVCAIPPPVCVDPQVLVNNICVTPEPVCVLPEVLTNGVCVVPTPVCVAPQVLQNNVCVTPVPVCVSPQILVNNICITPAPVCVAPQVLVNNVCVTPTPICVSPQTLVNNVCVDPPFGAFTVATKGITIDFKPGIVNPAITRWRWQFPNSLTPTVTKTTAAVVPVTYASPGTYTVTLQVTGTGVNITKTSTITIKDSPVGVTLP